MSRLVLAHWHAAEAEERAGRLRRAGHEVEIFSSQDPAWLRAIRENPPEAFVLDLSRLPSHGRAVATALRQQKPTRSVPLVFVAGEPEKVAQTRALLPDAVYTDWTHIRGAVREAIRRPPAKPVVPGTMAGYSGTPLPKKLGIRAGSSVLLMGAPSGFERTLGALPDGAQLLRPGARPSRPPVADLVLLFTKSQADLGRQWSTATSALADKGRIWIVWPKKASGIASDLTQQGVREYGLARSFVDYKICAVDETWSGLLFTRRRK